MRRGELMEEKKADLENMIETWGRLMANISQVQSRLHAFQMVADYINHEIGEQKGRIVEMERQAAELQNRIDSILKTEKKS
jgi:chromosome segregation ATPase